MNFVIFTKKMAVIKVIFFMVFMGIAILIVSAKKLIKDRHNISQTFLPGIFGAKSVLMFVMFEFLTALNLLSGAFGLYFGFKWGLSISLFSLVALIYISLRNSGWRIDGEESLKSEVLNIFSFAGGSVSIIILILSFQ